MKSSSQDLTKAWNSQCLHYLYKGCTSNFLLSHIYKLFERRFSNSLAHSRTGRLQTWKICTSQLLNITIYLMIRWIWEGWNHRCCIRWLLCSIRNCQPQDPHREAVWDDWGYEAHSPLKKTVVKQTILYGPHWESQSMADRRMVSPLW